MVIDTSPFANSLGSGDIVLFSYYSYEICELKIGACPFDSDIGFLASEKREKIIGIGVRSDPFCTEKILIECCDAMGSSSKPTIGESGIGYTLRGVLRFCCSR